MAKEQNRLEQDSIGKLMLKLCTQTTLSIMIYNIYTITDTFYVSKGIGSAARFFETVIEIIRQYL